MSGVRIVAAFSLRESLRRRVFVVVALLTVVFLALYALGLLAGVQVGRRDRPRHRHRGPGGGRLDPARAVDVRDALPRARSSPSSSRSAPCAGDAERGLLQPLLVRPLPRGTFLLGRFAAAAAVCAAYVIVVFLACVVITDAFGGWWPDRTVVARARAGRRRGRARRALARRVSVLLSSTANGIAVFMLFGAGLTAGLLGQIAEALSSDTLDNVAKAVLLGAAVRGALPGLAERDHRRHRRFHAAGHRPRARSAAPSRSARCSARGRSSTWPGSAPAGCGRSSAATCEGLTSGPPIGSASPRQGTPECRGGRDGSERDHPA